MSGDVKLTLTSNEMDGTTILRGPYVEISNDRGEHMKIGTNAAGDLVFICRGPNVAQMFTIDKKIRDQALAMIGAMK